MVRNPDGSWLNVTWLNQGDGIWIAAVEIDHGDGSPPVRVDATVTQKADLSFSFIVAGNGNLIASGSGYGYSAEAKNEVERLIEKFTNSDDPIVPGSERRDLERRLIAGRERREREAATFTIVI